ncbi:hypothetical protein AU080_00975 [Streptococcus equinus]|nr:hypothetical protein AU080_00975 [Streptococcus equinus]
MGTGQKELDEFTKIFHLDKRKATSKKDVATWFHLHLSTTKKSRKPQIGYIVATVLCLHKKQRK